MQEFKRKGFIREHAQMELAFWWRRVRAKNLKRTVLRQLIVARKAVGVIKARSGGRRSDSNYCRHEPKMSLSAHLLPCRGE